MIKPFFTLVTSVLLFACSTEPNESEEYQIISEVLNHSYAYETDDKNGLGWVDLSKPYDALRVLNHTNFGSVDIESLNDYLNFNELNEFSIEELMKYREWDIQKIKGYDRYRLETDSNKKDTSHYIGTIQFSSISFNEECEKAIIYTSYYCGGECGEGLIFHLVKNDKWEIEKVETMWVS